jgi:UDP-N-acetylmuramoyl-tripeptide--D-alanyl-D-alanine ligase
VNERMNQALWQWDELVAATGGQADGVPSRPVAGVSIDSRTLEPGNLFVALADQRDGHAYVGSAFATGAAAALVARAYPRGDSDGALLRVSNPLEALSRIGAAARRRTSARIVAVTGSVGKTGTKEALRACLSRCGPTHAAGRSFNNHWGVPLTLARMPAASAFGVFEIGMNHPGEITPLTRLARPHVTVVTTVEPVHLGHFASVEEIADAKAEIFRGLEPAGTAVLNRDNGHFARLRAHAEGRGARIVSFGRQEDCDVRAVRVELGPEGSEVEASVQGRPITYRLASPGGHIAQNSLAVLAALDALGADLHLCLPALADLRPSRGRGERSVLQTGAGKVLLIDESYNANPASMRAALATMASVPRRDYPRRIAVLGDMLELGGDALALHLALQEAIDAAGIDLVLACGPNMARLFERLDSYRKGSWAETAAGLEGTLLDTVHGGDAVMIKGSLGSRMGPLVEALKSNFRNEAEEPPSWADAAIGRGG